MVSGFDVKIIVLGCGNIGSVVALDLAESMPSARIVLADMNKDRAEKVAARIARDNVSWIQADASNHNELVGTIKGFDLTVGALPGFMGFRACKASISAGVNMVDVSFMPEDVMTLKKVAIKANVTVVPDCGMSPGLGSMLVGRASSQLETVESVHMYNGGLPAKPLPPLDYVITWSSKDLIELYTRKATIVRDGKLIEVPATGGVEELVFPSVGRLEAFYTDGLRTLLKTVRVKGDMWEKSLRYPGHVKKINLLKTLGFFEEKSVHAEGGEVSPRALTEKLLEMRLKRPEIHDIVAMHIEVVGLKNARRMQFQYRLLDRFDRKRKVTAMARTTAYTASIVAQLVAKRVITEEGVIPTEKLGMNKRVYTRFIGMMKQRSVTVKEIERKL
jgi:saccharopine dehydrogenase-like NADP-dependent oxidoreductase